MPYGQNERQNILQQTSMRHKKNASSDAMPIPREKMVSHNKKKGFLGQVHRYFSGPKISFTEPSNLKKKTLADKKASRRISQIHYDILTQRTQQTHQIYHIH